MPPLTLPFAGPDVEPQDALRFSGQLARVKEIMESGKWLTLREIQEALSLGAELQSISARIRDLRKAKFGGRKVERRRNGNQFEYRLLPEEAMF